MANKIRYPFGAADKISVAQSAAMSPTQIDNQETELTITGALAQNSTLNLTTSPEVNHGAMLRLRVTVDGTNRTLTPGTGITGAAQTLTASKSYLISYWFDGAAFVMQNVMLLN